MKRRVFAGILLAGLTVLAGCGTTEEAKRSASDDPPAVFIPSYAGLQNYSDVDAVLESIQPLGGTSFSMRLFIVAVRAQEGRPGVIDAGARVVASPLYDMDPSGGVDLGIPKNKALADLSNRAPGTKFTGILGVTKKGSWHIISVKGH